MKRVRIVIVIVFVALVVAIGWQVMKPSDEPVYKGKTLTNWIIEYTRVFSSPDGSESFVILDGNCDDVVREIGPNAVPTLLRLLRRRDSALRVRAMALLARQHVVKVDYVPAQRWNMLALLCLRVLGTNAQVAAPDLIGIADKNESGSFRRAAVDALGYVGPVKQVVPHLLQWATKPDPFVQIPAINGLGRLRPPAVEAVPHLMEWTTNSDQDVVVSAINALGGIGPPAKGAVPLLMGWATSARLRVAVNAKAALLQIDPEAAAKAGITNAP